ncbi:MAG: hypothetical protein J6S68_14380 [Acinetobacter sp.]|nr:hypothetical protein [Acinetobacter sp.]
MSELISKEEAKLAWANGKKLQIANTIVGEDFYDMDDSNTTLNIFDLDFYQFRLKPRTITISGIEVPAPFEPKEGEDCRCYYISTTFKHGFDWYHSTHHESNKIAWRTEEEIKQVVSALRSVFKGGVI